MLGGVCVEDSERDRMGHGVKALRRCVMANISDPMSAVHVIVMITM